MSCFEGNIPLKSGFKDSSNINPYYPSDVLHSNHDTSIRVSFLGYWALAACTICLDEPKLSVSDSRRENRLSQRRLK